MVSCKCGSDFASLATSRVSLQRVSITPDEFGGRSEAWSDTLAVWAHIEPMAGREVFISSQLQSRVDARMTIRFQSALADTRDAGLWRVRHDTRLYNIKFVKNLADDMKSEGTEFQQLLCVEAEVA